MHCSLIVTIAQNKRCTMMKLKQVCESTKNNNNGATSIASTDVVVVVVDDIDRRTKRYANELNQVLASSGVNNTNILIKMANA